jgi:uncharacterized membrane protein YphA (DoxX/SURF4 family)
VPFDKRADVFDRLLQVLLGAVFLWASWNKVLDPEGFARIVNNYRLLPVAWVGPTAVVLPWLELVCGLLLVCGVAVSGAVAVVEAMLAVFIAALAVNTFRGVDVACGCFSLEETAAGSQWRNILRDGLLLAAATWVLFRRINKKA